MSPQSLVATLALAAVVVSGAPGRAQSKFSDLICPNATEPVRHFAEARQLAHPDVDELIALGRKAIAAYDFCGAQKLIEGEATSGSPNRAQQLSSDAGVERLHYANLRAAQYHLAIGRFQRVLERYEEARTSDGAALRLLQDTIDWRSSSEINYHSNNVNVGSGSVHRLSTSASVYREDAIRLRAVAEAELGRLPPLPGPT